MTDGLQNVLLCEMCNVLMSKTELHVMCLFHPDYTHKMRREVCNECADKLAQFFRDRDTESSPPYRHIDWIILRGR